MVRRGGGKRGAWPGGGGGKSVAWSGGVEERAWVFSVGAQRTHCSEGGTWGHNLNLQDAGVKRVDFVAVTDQFEQHALTEENHKGTADFPYEDTTPATMSCPRSRSCGPKPPKLRKIDYETDKSNDEGVE